MSEEQDKDRARDQAKAQLESITEMIKRLEHCQACTDLGYLDDCNEGGGGGDSWEDAESYHDADLAKQAISEDPLEVSTRSGWHSPGAEEVGDAEYLILLCTGGPAVRITGQLDEHGEPDSARLEYQDWFTPWAGYPTNRAQEQTLLTYARQFYFGE